MALEDEEKEEGHRVKLRNNDRYDDDKAMCAVDRQAEQHDSYRELDRHVAEHIGRFALPTVSTVKG